MKISALELAIPIGHLSSVHVFSIVKFGRVGRAEIKMMKYSIVSNRVSNKHTNRNIFYSLHIRVLPVNVTFGLMNPL